MTVPRYSCRVCLHSWIPRRDTAPKVCPKCKSEKWQAEEDDVLYFVQKEGGGPIKIGHTRSIYSRMNLLRTHSETPLNILKIIPGGKERELEITSKFQHLKLNGEWYSPGEDLLDLINGLKESIHLQTPYSFPIIRQEPIGKKSGRPLRFSHTPIQTRLPPEENMKFEKQMEERGISASDLARELIVKVMRDQ